MTGDDDYGEAFKKRKLEHDQQREGPTEGLSVCRQKPMQTPPY